MLKYTLPLEVRIAREVEPPTEAAILALAEVMSALSAKFEADASLFWKRMEAQSGTSGSEAFTPDTFARGQHSCRIWAAQEFGLTSRHNDLTRIRD